MYIKLLGNKMNYYFFYVSNISSERTKTKYPERIMNFLKASISKMFSARGDVLSPYVVYKAKRTNTGRKPDPNTHEKRERN